MWSLSSRGVWRMKPQSRVEGVHLQSHPSRAHQSVMHDTVRITYGCRTTVLCTDF